MQMKKVSKIFQILVVCSGLAACSDADPGNFTAEEAALIREAACGTDGGNIPAGTMRVLTVEDSHDLTVLRAKSSDLSAEALLSEDFENLGRLMISTVTHPSQDGVGIAAPQVGLNRRVVAVQRFDKAGEPFELYPDIRIVWASDSLAYGPEGCLSVPDRREDVLRSQEIIIEYADMKVLKACPQNDVPMIRDTVKGFTAVIFQHEIDHLDGILYIDRVDVGIQP